MDSKRPMSEAKKRANKKWNDANLVERYDRIQLVVPKGHKDIIKTAADKAGESVNAYIVKAIYQRLERENIGQEEARGGSFCFSSDDKSPIL